MGSHTLLHGIFLIQGSHPGSPALQANCYSNTCYFTSFLILIPWSVQLSHSVVSDSLQPHELQHTSLPYPSTTPGAYSNSCPCSWDVIQPSHPLSSRFPPAFNLSQHQVFFSKSVLHIEWPKGWSFRFSISSSSGYSGLISFRIDWLDFLAVQQTLKSFLQHHRSKESVLRCSAFFIVQFSYPYVTTGKTIALTSRTFVGKIMSLFFNMPSRLVITFLPRSKCLLISWLQSPSAVILEP